MPQSKTDRIIRNADLHHYGQKGLGKRVRTPHTPPSTTLPLLDRLQRDAAHFDSRSHLCFCHLQEQTNSDELAQRFPDSLSKPYEYYPLLGCDVPTLPWGCTLHNGCRETQGQLLKHPYYTHWGDAGAKRLCRGSMSVNAWFRQLGVSPSLSSDNRRTAQGLGSSSNLFNINWAGDKPVVVEVLTVVIGSHNLPRRVDAICKGA